MSIQPSTSAPRYRVRRHPARQPGSVRILIARASQAWCAAPAPAGDPDGRGCSSRVRQDEQRHWRRAERLGLVRRQLAVHAVRPGRHRRAAAPALVPAVGELERLARRERAELEDGLHGLTLEPAPDRRTILAGHHDVERDGAAEQVELDGPSVRFLMRSAMGTGSPARTLSGTWMEKARESLSATDAGPEGCCVMAVSGSLAARGASGRHAAIRSAPMQRARARLEMSERCIRASSRREFSVRIARTLADARTT